ncbi:MAG TPA: chemotaxis protein CheA, partial [Candidatus Methanoperedens sp.]|nr:chemotaxis protein CheA [Candidatus Methanoperedens sp.]
MDLSKYRQLFLDEGREHLGLLNRELLRLEREGGGVDALFRAAHSLKGMAGSMGYTAIVAVAHALEDVLDLLRTQALAATPALLPLLFEGVDALGALVAEVEQHGTPRRDVADLAGRLRAAASAPAAPAGPAAPAPTAQPAPVAPAPAPGGSFVAETADLLLRETVAQRDGFQTFSNGADRGAESECVLIDRPASSCGPLARAETAAESLAAAGGILDLDPERRALLRDLVRGGRVPYACRLRVAKDSAAMAARNFVILGRLAQAGTLLASSPTREEVRAGVGREVVDAILLAEVPEERLRALLLAIPELRELRLARLRLGEGGAGAAATAAGEGSLEAAPVLLAPGAVAVEHPPGAVPGLADRFAPKRAATVRVDTRVLDELINIVGEMIITRERLEEIGGTLGSEGLDANLERLRALVRGFQDTIMTVRMMPLDLVTDRLPRLVRDVALASGKQIAFEVDGRGIEMDRAILEELNDVLIHLVRNAVDHGIEGPEARAAAGKEPKAMVRVRAGRERDWFWVSVEDDGRGMDPERIAAAAIERGLVGAERAAARGEREKLLLCCLPGVSTAGSVTDISGRGVGMDVVKARVDAFGGTLRIDSQPGRGTAITLRLPLTLAIIRVLLVEVHGREYGLPVSHVARTGFLEQEVVAWSGGRPLLEHGGRLVPLHDLGVLLGRPARDLHAAAGLCLAVAEFSERAAGLVVDRLL